MPFDFKIFNDWGRLYQRLKVSVGLWITGSVNINLSGQENAKGDIYFRGENGDLQILSIPQNQGGKFITVKDGVPSWETLTMSDEDGDLIRFGFNKTTQTLVDPVWGQISFESEPLDSGPSFWQIVKTDAGKKRWKSNLGTYADVVPVSPVIIAQDNATNTITFMSPLSIPATQHEYRIKSGETWSPWFDLSSFSLNVGASNIAPGSLQIRSKADPSEYRSASLPVENTIWFTS